MMRKHPEKGSCVVCATNDSRALVTAALTNGERVILCGTHDLMHRRAKTRAASSAALVQMFADRRDADRRGGTGEVDELAESLSAAFMRERRVASRRVS